MLLTFGLSGIVVIFSLGGNYVQRNYFHTSAFQSELDSFASYLNMFVLNDIPLEEAKKMLTVTEEEMNENGAAARTKLLQEKEKQLEEYYRERETFRSEYAKYNDQFVYYFRSSLSDEFYTNMNSGNAEAARKKMDRDNQRLLFRTSYYVTKELQPTILNAVHGELNEKYIPFQGEIAVYKDLPASSPFMVEYNRYRQGQLIVWSYAFAAIAALVICGLKLNKKMVFPLTVSKWEVHYNKLPMDLRIILMALTGVSAILLLFSVKGNFEYLYGSYFAGLWTFVQNMLIWWVLASLLVLLTFIQGKFMLDTLTNWQYTRQEWERGLLNRAVQRMKLSHRQFKMILVNAFLRKSTGMQWVLLVLAVFTCGALTVITVLHPGMIFLYALFLVIAGIPLIWFFIKQLGYFNRIVIKTDELARGVTSQDLPVNGKSVLAAMAGNMNVLAQASKTWQNEQAKSERLKTELITNVSHDLRTPLTSIITYTELLKKEDVSREDRQAYVNIIDQKSQRLKVLIDDLFEISKMASGNVELVKEKVDLIQLLQQALAEYNDMIHESSLHFRLSHDSDPVYAMVDGQKLWRVFDNLIGNILKYSLEHSRVYISVQALENQAAISFKNVSKYELSGDRDELLERFKRGDSSRQTEGSGLGLDIAKSIVELHGGQFDVTVEGDLFKVNITLG